MIPDYLKLKEKLKKKINHTMQQALLSHLGPIADAPTFIFFEGNKAIIIREDGSVGEMNPKGMRVDQEIKLSELEGMNHEMVLDKINCLAKKMAEKQEKLSYEVMRKAAQEVGNVTNSSGGSFSIDALLKVLEKMHIDFDEEGQPSGLTFVANPNAPIDEAFLQAADDPRYQALMERKREEWRVRENNRKLVG